MNSNTYNSNKVKYKEFNWKCFNCDIVRVKRFTCVISWAQGQLYLTYCLLLHLCHIDYKTVYKTVSLFKTGLYYMHNVWKSMVLDVLVYQYWNIYEGNIFKVELLIRKGPWWWWYYVSFWRVSIRFILLNLQ
jgi:hypothetical protein